MPTLRGATVVIIAAFLLGFAMGGMASLYYAQAEGLELTASVEQIGSPIALASPNGTPVFKDSQALGHRENP